MNRVIINFDALRHNLRAINRLMERQGARWSIVTKGLCGHQATIKALELLGARSVADSRLDNLSAINAISPGLEKWYLRLPHLSVIEDVVRLADVSLNSEIKVIKSLSEEAQRQDKIHHIVIMIELGDLREGILPGTLVRFYEEAFNQPAINVLGVGAQIGCLAGAVPNVDQISQLLLYRELLELKFARQLHMVSAGSTAFLPLLTDGGMPRGVNHYRIGEALFLGTDLVNGGTLDGFRDDVVFLDGEIAEIKVKSLTPMAETGTSTPFEGLEPDENNAPAPGQRGYRALVTVGQLDTDVAGLTPVNSNYHVAGASSDVTVVNLGDQPDGLTVGDTIRFRVNYSAFVRLMNDPYIAKQLNPPLDELKDYLLDESAHEADMPDTAPPLELVNGAGSPQTKLESV